MQTSSNQWEKLCNESSHHSQHIIVLRTARVTSRDEGAKGNHFMLIGDFHVTNRCFCILNPRRPFLCGLRTRVNHHRKFGNQIKGQESTENPQFTILLPVFPNINQGHHSSMCGAASFHYFHSHRHLCCVSTARPSRKSNWKSVIRAKFVGKSSETLTPQKNWVPLARLKEKLKFCNYRHFSRKEHHFSGSRTEPNGGMIYGNI